jgi:hypothetical protein
MGRCISFFLCVCFVMSVQRELSFHFSYSCPFEATNMMLMFEYIKRYLYISKKSTKCKENALTIVSLSLALLVWCSFFFFYRFVSLKSFFFVCELMYGLESNFYFPSPLSLSSRLIFISM